MPTNNVLPVMKYADVKDNIGNGKPLILSFGMSHCYSCLAMSKVFAEVLEAHPDYQIYSIDSQKERLVSRDIYKLKEMPAQIFLMLPVMKCSAIQGRIRKQCWILF